MLKDYADVSTTIEIGEKEEAQDGPAPTATLWASWPKGRPHRRRSDRHSDGMYPVPRYQHVESVRNVSLHGVLGQTEEMGYLGLERLEEMASRICTCRGVS